MPDSPRPFDSSEVEPLIDYVDHAGHRVDLVANKGADERRLTVSPNQEDFREVVANWCQELAPETPVFVETP